MKSLFTIHAGEYLVGSYIESKFKNVNIWLPSKDTGIDLLLTNKNNTKSVSIQVKFSKDFLATNMDDIFQQKGLKSCGWWTLNKKKIETSNADYWIFVLQGFYTKDFSFIILKPIKLLELFNKLERDDNTIQTYFWVTTKKKCWETRGLSIQDKILVANHSYKNTNRDLSSYLNNWKPILNLLKV
jgi:hypothetical protein